MKVNKQDILLQVFPLEGKIKTWSLREVVQDNDKVLAGSTAGACIQKAVPCMYVHIRLRGIKGNECSLGDSACEFLLLHSGFTLGSLLKLC